MDWAVLAVASVAMSAVAQTVTGTGTAVNTVPVVTATTSTTTTLGSSPILVSGGNVGIGTTNPVLKLQVNGSAGSYNGIDYAVINDTTNNPSIQIWNSTGDRLRYF
jgi:hypothetical protein